MQKPRKKLLLAALWVLCIGLLWWQREELMFFSSTLRELVTYDAIELRATSTPDLPGKAAPFDCKGVTPVPGKPKLKLALVAQTKTSLVDIAFAPGQGQRLYVLEQHKGRVRVVEKGQWKPAPFLDLSAKISRGFERGLLAMAFHPRYASSPKHRKFYVYLTNPKGAVEIVEYRALTPYKAEANSRRVVLTVAQPEANHNGGGMAFGPDGLLYLGLGDGGGAGDHHGPRGFGQDPGSLLGKILRIDVDARSPGKGYGIPPTNPFRSRRGFRPEILHWGLRNPWRIGFDASSGSLWIGDVGQDAAEELDVASPKALGLNFGWRCREGLRPFAMQPHCKKRRLTPPVLHLSHGKNSGSPCSVIAGQPYRGCKMPGYHGTVFYGDWCMKHLRAFYWDGKIPSLERRLEGLPLRQLSSIRQDPRGELYMSTTGGKLFRLVPDEARGLP